MFDSRGQALSCPSKLSPTMRTVLSTGPKSNSGVLKGILTTWWRSIYQPQPLHLHWIGGSSPDMAALTQLSHLQFCGHPAGSIMQIMRTPDLTKPTTLKTEGAKNHVSWLLVGQHRSKLKTQKSGTVSERRSSWAL